MITNLTKRILVTLLAVPLIVLITWLGHYLFFVFVTFLVLIGQWEFYHMNQVKNTQPYTITGMISGVIICAGFLFFHLTGIAELMTAIIMLICLKELYRFKPEGGISRISVTLLGVVYVAWLMGHAILLRELPLFIKQPYVDGLGYIFLAFLPTWIGDTAAYGFGSKFGTIRFCPPISPKKSVQGSVAGLIFSLLTILLLKFIYADYLTIFSALCLGLILGIMAQLGDLIESLMKRDAGIKDSSHLLPGHGGILDRFDAAFFTIPTTYYYLKFVVF